MRARSTLVVSMCDLIAFGHYAQVGKDTAARVLTDTGVWERFAFADKVRETLLAINPLFDTIPTIANLQPTNRLSHIVETKGWEKAKENLEVRRLLQEFATNLRAVDEDMWLRPAEVKLEELRSRGMGMVITDLRFPNEAAWVAGQGGLLVKITRPGYGPSRDHESETALNDWHFDYTLDNCGTVEGLWEQVLGIVNG